ncbi:MAG: hypothetical protein ACHBN1_31800 [Heteroscytonema crispum UTEX LB 1556]
MSPNTNSSIPQNIMSALSELEDEVAKVEQALLELRQKKQEALQYQLSTGIEDLETQANRINAIADSLESEILKFKETAVEVNYLYNSIHDSPALKTAEPDKSKSKSITSRSQLTNIWEMKNIGFSIPTVVKRESQFIITVKAIALHKENAKETAPQENLHQTSKLPQFQQATKIVRQPQSVAIVN